MKQAIRMEGFDVEKGKKCGCCKRWMKGGEEHPLQIFGGLNTHGVLLSNRPWVTIPSKP